MYIHLTRYTSGLFGYSTHRGIFNVHFCSLKFIKIMLGFFRISHNFNIFGVREHLLPTNVNRSRLLSLPNVYIYLICSFTICFSLFWVQYFFTLMQLCYLIIRHVSTIVI